MPNPESQRKLATREELETALNEAAEEKITELKINYGNVPVLKKMLEGTIARIETEQENFHNIEMNKILRFGSNTFQDVYEIFLGRIKIHCLDIRNAADDLDVNEPKSSIHTVQKGVTDKISKVA